MTKLKELELKQFQDQLSLIFQQIQKIAEIKLYIRNLLQKLTVYEIYNSSQI